MIMTKWFYVQVSFFCYLMQQSADYYMSLGPGNRKIGEYGGNTLGFGSKSVLGAGWPKDVIKVEGDTLTICFEMRSGREHNTPDKVVWGFRVSIRAQEQEDTSTISPFTADVAFTLTNLLHSYIEVQACFIITSM